MRSTPNRRVWTWLALCAIIAIPGCDNDDQVFTAPGEFSEGAMAALNDDVVIPTVEGLGIADDAFGVIAAVGGVPSAACECPFSCLGGTCASTPQAGASGCTLDFTACTNETGSHFNGTVDIIGTTNSGGASYDIEINGSTVRGGIDYVRGKGCFSAYYGGLEIESSFGSVVQSGNLTWCSGSDYPTGQMVNRTSGSVGDFAIDVLHEGTGSPMACIYEDALLTKGEAFGDFLGECVVNIVSGSVSCDFDSLSSAVCGSFRN